MKTLILLAALLVLGGGYLVVRDVYPKAEAKPHLWRVTTRDGYQPLLVLDINHAPADSLELIPGIGPVLADRIVTYRRDHGPYAAVESLVHVPGIGPAAMEKIKPYIQVP